MNIIDKFTIQEHEGDYEKRPLKSLLYYRGKALGKKVSGYVIEKQFELDDYFLLLINWDCQFEESCEIIVINKLQKIVGHYSFTSFYNSYNLRTVCELSKNNFRLTFNESDNFEVIINYPKKHLLSKVVTVSAIR
ncbi:hypothetical protein [Psychromonas arctica]|uniref:hypothetical protein n=1 Tax=Psychromonas arctica TaxID=168275 RepID=UPI002FD646C0